MENKIKGVSIIEQKFLIEGLHRKSIIVSEYLTTYKPKIILIKVNEK